MFKKIIYAIVVALLATSCADTFNSVKRGLTGAKANTSDEFMIKKKDPLILPPDYENLPTPDERSEAAEEVFVFEKALENSIEEQPSSGSVEDSILKKIQTK